MDAPQEPQKRTYQLEWDDDAGGWYLVIGETLPEELFGSEDGDFIETTLRPYDFQPGRASLRDG